MSISFRISKRDAKQVSAIVERVTALIPGACAMVVQMDLVATHANGCPLDFEALKAADDFNLVHDIVGIGRHLDRVSGKLTGGFRPRFARRAA